MLSTIIIIRQLLVIHKKDSTPQLTKNYLQPQVQGTMATKPNCIKMSALKKDLDSLQARPQSLDLTIGEIGIQVQEDTRSNLKL